MRYWNPTVIGCPGTHIRVWLGDQQIIDQGEAHSLAKATSDSVHLNAGQQYELKIEFYETTGFATARLMWTYPGQNEAVVP